MRWIADPTGRFRQRPYYNSEELDTECERIVSQFLEDKYGICYYPVSTDDLTVMIEQDTSDLDLYADLSGVGEDVEGLTDFFPHKKPAVKIARELSLDSARSHRLRTTLAHEYGHVKFHTFLWELSRWENRGTRVPRNIKTYRLYEKVRLPEVSPRCKRSRILDAPYSDWMEWQAGYACGAFLMPVSAVRRIIRIDTGCRNDFKWIPDNSDQAAELICSIAETFDVSEDAARIRLYRLGILQKTVNNDSIFTTACAGS